MNIITMGMPAAGKDTVCERLANEFLLCHVNTGAILREEKEAGTKIGLMAARLIDAGNYMPDDIMISMVKERIMASSGYIGRVFNGFPRTKTQAKYLNAFLLMRKEPIKGVIYLDVDKQIAIERIRERALKEGRPDDGPEVVGNRLAQYNNNTAPLLDFFSKRGLLNVIKANGPKEEVYRMVSGLVKPWMQTAA